VTKSPSQEDLVPLLECPVCFDLPLPPIRTCYQGHIICVNCCDKLSVCPLCQKPIGIGRNYFAETFLNTCTMRCRYYEDGCAVELPGSKIRAHMDRCNYR
jgi:E3 ubiquitin-protein ligase SIAH1